MIEQWKEIPGLDGRYSASSEGRIRSNGWQYVSSRGQRRSVAPSEIRCGVDNRGYRRFTACSPLGNPRRYMSVHRAVCMAFHGEPCGDVQVAHGDGDPLNNRPENLRWATASENAGDRHMHGMTNEGSDVHTAKLTDVCVHIIRAMGRSGNYRQADVADMFGVTPASIHNVVAGKTWKHLPGASYGNRKD